MRWELDWLLKMQADDGSVYHKLSTRNFGGFVSPEKETEPRYFSPWSSAATASFVAVMAQSSRVFQQVDKTFSTDVWRLQRRATSFCSRIHRIIDRTSPHFEPVDTTHRTRTTAFGLRPNCGKRPATRAPCMTVKRADGQ